MPALAIGETVILMTPLLSLLKCLLKVQGGLSNDSLADG